MAPLVGKHVLIIGGSSGIGFGVARTALAEGARVTIASSSETKVRAAVQRLGGEDKVAAEVVNASEESEVKALFERVGSIDHLVFTAGEPIVALEMNISKIKSGISALKSLADLRYYGVLICARYAKGRVNDSITITSGIMGVRPIPEFSAVAGIPGGLFNTARALAIDLAPLRVNCIAPGLIETELLERLPAKLKEPFIQKALQTQPVPHIGTPEETAEAYVFAMKCSYLTGQTLIVDGGATLV